MSSALYALGRWAFRARGRMLAAWLVVLALLFTGAALLGVGTDNTYSIPGTESQDALDALARTFPQVSGTSAQLIAVAPDGGDVTDPDFEAAIVDAITAIEQIPQVTAASSPYDSPGSANLSSDDSAALVPIQLSVGSTSVLPSTVDALQEAGADPRGVAPRRLRSLGRRPAVLAELDGHQHHRAARHPDRLLRAAHHVRLVHRRGPAAHHGAARRGCIPGDRVHRHAFLTITSTTPLLALMLGLAVGIDYALFIISRHQDQLKHSLDPEESAARPSPRRARPSCSRR